MSKRGQLNVIILAAGKGQRMRSSLPKVLHRLAGIPMLERVVNTARTLNPKSIYVVYGNGGEYVRSAMSHLDVEWVEQNKTLGTGHAVKQVIPHLAPNDRVLVLYGDVPLISSETLNDLLNSQTKNGLGLVVTEVDNPTGFGRIIRNEMGNIVAIVEEKDANEEEKEINEINTGIMTTSAELLQKLLPHLSNKHNAQNEYYLTDIVSLAVADGHPVGGILAHCDEEVRGVNSLDQLALLERYYQQEMAFELMREGVRISDPARFDLRGHLTVGQNAFIDINVILEGDVTLGDNVYVGPNVILRNVNIGDGVRIEANTMIEDAVIEKACKVGPFARIRPGTHLEKDAKVGNFVEVKNTKIGAGSKASHLSYLGDAQIGKDVNIGAGTITCNYDGSQKHQTVIEDGAFVGSDVKLVAPIKVGKKARIGAGSTLTDDAPSHSLTIARARQVVVDK